MILCYNDPYGQYGGQMGMAQMNTTTNSVPSNNPSQNAGAALFGVGPTAAAANPGAALFGGAPQSTAASTAVEANPFADASIFFNVNPNVYLFFFLEKIKK